MGASSATERNDRVLGTTRALAAFIIPALVIAFVVLYPDPDASEDWFAWHIKPTMTSMVLASAYLGGAYFFVRVLFAREWHTVRLGFLPVTLFASTLGVATALHWDRFDHDHVAFWLWAGLYFTTPFLVPAVWWRNEQVARPRSPAEPVLAAPVRLVAGIAGLGAGALGAILFVAPDAAADFWPWALTPLTSRVVGPVLLLGVAGLAVAVVDPRQSASRIMLDVMRIMVVLMLVAGVRAHDELEFGRPLTWLLMLGLVGVVAGSTLLLHQPREGAEPPVQPAAMP